MGFSSLPPGVFWDVVSWVVMGDRSEIRSEVLGLFRRPPWGFKQVMAASSAASGIAPPCPSPERDAVRLASGSFGSKNSPSPKPPLPTGTPCCSGARPRFLLFGLTRGVAGEHPGPPQLLARRCPHASNQQGDRRHDERGGEHPEDGGVGTESDPQE
jgi:hypothetical protein